MHKVQTLAAVVLQLNEIKQAKEANKTKQVKVECLCPNCSSVIQGQGYIEQVKGLNELKYAKYNNNDTAYVYGSGRQCTNGCYAPGATTVHREQKAMLAVDAENLIKSLDINFGMFQPHVSDVIQGPVSLSHCFD